MAAGKVEVNPPSGNRQFVVGLLLGLVFIAVIVLATLAFGGYIGTADAELEAGSVQSITSDDLTPAPKPTAAWRFRADWLTPAH
jgi:hypothetical protein